VGAIIFLVLPTILEQMLKEAAYTKGILVFGYRKAMPAMSMHPLASI